MMKKLLSLSVLIAMFAFISCTEVRDSAGNDENSSATPEKTTYTVTFNSNDETNKSYTQTFVSGESQLLNENCFTRTGYNFAGWNTKRNGYGTSYSDRARLTATYDITLYAQWIYIGSQDTPDNPVKTYTVTFNSNDGTNKSYTQTFINGQSQNLNVNCFVRNGYTFAGWNTSSDGYGTSYADKRAITIYSDKILYAQWTYIGNEEEPDPNPNPNPEPNPNPDNPVQTYTVTFYSNDGTDKSYTQTFVRGQAQYLNMNCFYRMGYTFAGWNTSSDGYGTSYNDTGLLLPEEIISDMALYAIWEINTYTVKFDANGGSGEMYNQTFTYGESEKLIPNTFYRTDYKFVGWATTPNGNAVCTDEMAVLNLSTQANDEVTLYAVWTENIYTVVFDANGGNGEMSDISLTYDVAEQLPANTFYRTGYTFVGWAVTPNGSVFYTDEEDVLNITTKDKTTMKLYAVWSANNSGLTITLPDSNDEQINLKQIVSGEEVMFYVKTGFDSYAWYIDGIKQSEKTATFTIDTSIMNSIIYKIMVIVSFNDEYYSATADLEVKRVQ